MKVTKNYVFILIILCFTANGINSMRQMKFYLSEQDQLRLPIEEFLDYQQTISLLTYKASEETNVYIPKPAERVDINVQDRSGFGHNEKIQILDSTSYDNITAKLCIDEQKQHHVILDTFNHTDDGIDVVKTNLMEIKAQNCSTIQMDDTNIYLGCYSYFKDSLQLCIQNYIEKNIQMECEEIYQAEKEKPVFQNQNLKLEIFNNVEGTVVLMYLENSDYQLFKDHVILYQSGTTQIMHISKKDLQIKKIQLIDYNFKLQTYSFLVLNKLQNNESQLFYYKYEANKAKSSEVASIQSQDIVDYFLVKSKIMILKNSIIGNTNKVQITEFDIFSKQQRVYDLQDIFQDNQEVIFKEVLRFEDSAVIALEVNEKSDNLKYVVYLYYDQQSQRINEFASGFISDQNCTQKPVKILDQNYLSVSVNNENHLFQLNHCRHITIHPLKKNKKSNIVFSYDDESFFNIDLNYVDDEESIDFTKTTRLMLNDSICYNPIRLYNNQPDKQYPDNTQFLNIAKLEEDVLEDLDVCDSHNIKLIDNVLIDFCMNHIIDFHYLTLQKENTNNKQTTLLKKYGHQSIMPLQDLSDVNSQFDFKNVSEYSIIFQTVVLMLTKNNEIYYYSIKSHRQQLIKIQFDENVENCHIESYKIICERDQQTVIFSFNFIDSILEIKDEKIINVKKDFIVISKVKKDYIAYLIKYPNTQHYNLIGQSDIKDLNVEIPDQYVNETTKLYEISEDNYVITTNVDDHLVMKGIKNSSLIHYETMSLVYFQFLGIKTTQHSNYFMLLLQEVSSNISFVIYNSSYQVKNRLIVKQQTKRNTKQDLEYSVQDIDQSNLLIHIGKKNNLDEHEFFVFRKNGPLIINDNSQNEVNYGTTDQPRIIKNEIEQFETHLKIKVNQLGLEKNENIVTKNLEDLQVVQIDGDYIQVYQPKNPKGYFIQDRLTTIKKNYLIKESHMIKESFNIQSNVENSTLSLNFNTFHYRGNRISNNMLYDDCLAVQNTDNQKYQTEEKIHLYLCRENLSKLFVLTNFDDLNIKIKNLDSALKPSKAYTIFNEQDQFHLIISLDSNHHDIMIYEFNLNDKSYEVSREYFFNSNQLNDQFEPYNNFYAVLNKNNNSISLMFNSQFDSFLYIFEYNLLEKIIKLKEMQKLHIVTDTRQNLLSIEFNNQLEYIECVYVTEVSLNVIYLRSKRNQDWIIDPGFSKTIKKGLKIEHPKISIKDDYVALLINRDETSTNVLIWKKNNADYIYYGLSLVEFAQGSLSPKYQIYVENIHLRNYKDSSYLDVVYLQRNFGEQMQQNYDSLILQTFQIGQFTISLDKELVDLNGIELNFQKLKLDGVISQQLLIKSDEQKKVVLHTAMVILLILVIVLALIAQGVWSKNKELRDELKKDLRERDMASERV